MNEEKTTFSEVEQQNKVAFFGNMVAALVYSFVFTCELQLGHRPIWYCLIGYAATWGPALASVYYWKKDHETPMIKHVIAIGFAVLYSYSLLTTTDSSVYVYVFPMLLIVSVFNDFKYVEKICTGVIILNLATPIAGIVTGSAFGYRSSSQAGIQMISSVIMCIAACFVMKTLEQNASNRVKIMAESKKETDKLLARVTRLTEKMTESIDEINSATDALQSSAAKTKEAMEQVSIGAADTAEAVERQMVGTQAI